MNITLEKIKQVYRHRAPRPIGPHKFFSVLVPLVEKDGKVHLLFEVRAKDMESQPGEICFPGGHLEEGETLEACALRETFEEIGIAPENVEVIGQGDVLYGYANYTLYTYMGIIQYEDYLNAKIDPAEVDEIFLVPIDDLIANPPQIHDEQIYSHIGKEFPYDKVGIKETYQWRVGNWVIPIYDIEGRIIWGLTARITENVIHSIW
ncbi:coenzyme A diphosphatase NUDT7 [Clostridiales Family XIII bacterium PM5-7]